MKVLVLGASISGRAAMRLAVRQGHEVVVYDARASALDDLAVPTIAGDLAVADLAGVDLVVTSPGIPEHSTVSRLVQDSGIELIGEIEFAARSIHAPLAAVTGTNGKTTTTEAAAAMLVASGLEVRAVGNVGAPLSDEVGEDRDALVVEVSSFQLRFIDSFRPAAAAILNIAPDHLDWHGTMDAYVAAKARITENQTEGDILVYDPDDAVVTAAIAASAAFPVPVSGRRRPEGGNGPDGPSLHISGHLLERPPLDEAFTFDLTVAATLALHLGASIEGVAEVITGFTTGAHRRQVVGTWAGVTWVNDSKATNPHAAAAAVGAYESVVLIAGGRNKGLDLAPVFESDRLRHVVAIGETASDVSALVGQDRCSIAASMEEAVAIAAEIAESGDTVLLAPACASFDMFTDYVERGEVFAAAARRHAEIRGGV